MDEKMLDLMTSLYDEMQKGFNGVNERIEKVEGRIEKVEDRLGNIENRLGKVEMKIDGEITDKVRALFDDREVIHEKLDNLQMDINTLTAKTANHDNKIIELSRKIK